jgi:lipopolysaccharide export system protein LptA
MKMVKAAPLSGQSTRRGRRASIGFAALALGALVAFGALGASAPESAAQLAQSGGPITYSADNLEYSEGDNRLILTGAVDLVQGDARLRCNRLTLFFRAGSTSDQGVGSGDIERMIAEGEVYYLRPAQQARGDRAVYDTNSDTVTFTGNVVVASEDNVIRGQTLVLQVSGGRTTVTSERGRRVQGVVNPSSRPQQRPNGG